MSVTNDGEDRTTTGDDDVDWIDEDDEVFGPGSAADWIKDEAIHRDPGVRSRAAGDELLRALFAVITRPAEQGVEVLQIAKRRRARAARTSDRLLELTTNASVNTDWQERSRS